MTFNHLQSWNLAPCDNESDQEKGMCHSSIGFQISYQSMNNLLKGG